jgi:hypothetical protein
MAMGPSCRVIFPGLPTKREPPRTSESISPDVVSLSSLATRCWLAAELLAVSHGWDFAEIRWKLSREVRFR